MNRVVAGVKNSLMTEVQSLAESLVNSKADSNDTFYDARCLKFVMSSVTNVHLPSISIKPSKHSLIHSTPTSSIKGDTPFLNPLSFTPERGPHATKSNTLSQVILMQQQLNSRITKLKSNKCQSKIDKRIFTQNTEIVMK